MKNGLGSGCLVILGIFTFLLFLASDIMAAIIEALSDGTWILVLGAIIVAIFLIVLISDVKGQRKKIEQFLDNISEYYSVPEPLFALGGGKRNNNGNEIYKAFIDKNELDQRIWFLKKEIEKIPDDLEQIDEIRRTSDLARLVDWLNKHHIRISFKKIDKIGFARAALERKQEKLSEDIIDCEKRIETINNMFKKDREASLDKLVDSFEVLKSSKYFDITDKVCTLDTIQREIISMDLRYKEDNEPFFGRIIGDCRIYFFPYYVWVFKSDKRNQSVFVGACLPDEITAVLTTQELRAYSEQLSERYADATFFEKSEEHGYWQHSNMDGGRDHRYKNNEYITYTENKRYYYKCIVSFGVAPSISNMEVSSYDNCVSFVNAVSEYGMREQMA